MDRSAVPARHPPTQLLTKLDGPVQDSHAKDSLHLEEPLERTLRIWDGHVSNRFTFSDFSHLT